MNNIKIKSSSIILLLVIFHLSLFLTALDVSAERLSVKSNTANIRSGPATTYKVLWQIEKYHPVDVIKKKGNWYQFKDFESDSGWIHKSLLSNMATVITKKNCNIRSGPGTKYKIAFTTEKGIPLKIIEKKEKWLHVQHADGDKGWINKPLVW